MNRYWVSVLVIIVAILAYSQLSPKDSQSYTPNHEIIAQEQRIPWSMVIIGDQQILFTEREGNVKLVNNKTVTQIHHLDVATGQGSEGGLLGLAISTDNQMTQKVYLYYTYLKDGQLTNRISSYTFTGSELVDEKTILDDIPGGRNHNGGRIAFGPDGKLYITTGEIGERNLAQNQESLAGKILRLNSDGSVPSDNPFPGSEVYSLGHRNPQGLSWHPKLDLLYITEHGPSGEGLQFAHDEINLIVSGGNYGWPQIVAESENALFIDPVYHTGSETWAPSGAVFINDPQSVWHLRLVIACLRGNGLRIVELSDDGQDVVGVESVFEEFGRVRDVALGNDGEVFICTSNRDGRGSAKENDDVIIKIYTRPR